MHLERTRLLQNNLSHFLPPHPDTEPRHPHSTHSCHDSTPSYVRGFLHVPLPSKDVIKLTNSSGSARQKQAHSNSPIIISSSGADTPPRQPQLSQMPISCKAGPKCLPPPNTEVICISDSDDDNVPASLPATAVLPNQNSSPALPSLPPIVMESENEIMVDLKNQFPEDSFYVLMEPESDFDEEMPRSELQCQTEEFLSCIDLDPPEPDFADQNASPIAHADCNDAQDSYVPAPDILRDSTPPSLK
ncbi:hypothetical protein BDR06DRAFT_1013808 [Suillus hirtellus]|nr:hypothetical protein BDR06DRAFT_1013808 [Suillus hirtellus]